MSEENKKDLVFWDQQKMEKGGGSINLFPNRDMSNEELIFILKNLGGKIEIFKESPCFHYLQKFHSFSSSIPLARNKKQIDILGEASIQNLQFFQLCWEEKHKKKSLFSEKLL